MNESLSVGEWFFRSVDEFENAPPDCRQTADGCALEAYLCPSGQWTIGDGCCFWEDGSPVQQGDTLEDGPGLEERRKSLLMYNAHYCEAYIRQHVTVPLTQNQFDALCDFRFNTRETTLRNSTRLLPAINAQEWQKAAMAFTEFVYGTSTYEGKPYQRAMRGLLRRRLWNGLVFLGYNPEGAVKDDDVALPSDRKLLSSGVYRDIIRSEGVTTLNQVRMKAAPLQASPEPVQAPQPVPAVQEPAKAEPAPAVKQDSGTLILTKDMKAAPETAPVAAGEAPSPPNPSVASPASVQKTAPVSPGVGTGEGVSPLPSRPAPPSPNAPVPGAKEAAPAPSLPKAPPPPRPPVAAPPPPNDPLPADLADPKDMLMSRRFWGLFITGLSTINFLPRGVQEWMSNTGNRELLSWVVLAAIGFCVYQWGRKKATRPLK